jgi:hypothetical protein
MKGDDDGADDEADMIAQMHLTRAQIIAHPPKTRTAADLLARDRAIAETVDYLIAAPRTDKEETRSGTWATVRYARTAGVPVILLPRGVE